MPNEVKAQNTINLTSLKELNDAVENTDQYFWHTETGQDAGAHITEVPKDVFISNPQGGNTLIDSNNLKIRDGLTELASFSASGVNLGSNSKNASVKMCGNYGEMYFENTAPEYGYLNLVNRYGYHRTGVEEASLELACMDYDGLWYPSVRLYTNEISRASGTVISAPDNDYRCSESGHEWRANTGGGVLTDLELTANSLNFSGSDVSLDLDPNGLAVGFGTGSSALSFSHADGVRLSNDDPSNDKAYFKVNSALGEVYFGVGAAGVNHGVYSATNRKWIAHADNSGNVFLDGINLAKLIKVVTGTTTGTFTLNAGAGFYQDVPLSAPSGYTLVVVAGFDSNHNQAVSIGGAKIQSNSSIRVSGRNTSNNNYNDMVLTAYGLYVLSGAVT